MSGFYIKSIKYYKISKIIYKKMFKKKKALENYRFQSFRMNSKKKLYI